MIDPSFAPVLYIKKNCPFCLKARIFLLEAGLLARFEVKEFSAGSDDERVIEYSGEDDRSFRLNVTDYSG